MTRSRALRAAWWIGLALAAQTLSGCATGTAYQVGRRECKTPGNPPITELGVTDSSLYIGYKCNLTKATWSWLGVWGMWGYSGSSLGQSEAVARVRFKDLFDSRNGGSVPVQFSPGKGWFHYYTRDPSAPIGGAKPCYSVTGTEPNFEVHSDCGDNRATASLWSVYWQAREGITYRTLWGYALLPITMPIAVAVDVATSPLYALIILSLPNHMSDRNIEERTRAAQTIAYDWPRAR